ncbi:hypothetical protein [Amycolatopsis albispora]|uniref:Uncharacterized protein n=1 Tax=Amycolatopsis albispora TaxID=1804986 RepID=A0A344LJF0_9PSEU|nr:hypothetical protein [Amycolatopsis albispora]AXB48174.1 hypothetical protein A4R43_41810 [Amycolatopsis albispora]
MTDSRGAATLEMMFRAWRTEIDREPMADCLSTTAILDRLRESTDAGWLSANSAHRPGAVA